MRLTYGQLAEIILKKMTPEQQMCDVTTEIFDGENTECFASEIRICNNEHDSLNDGHPVIFVNQCQEHLERLTDIDEFCKWW